METPESTNEQIQQDLLAALEEQRQVIAGLCTRIFLGQLTQEIQAARIDVLNRRLTSFIEAQR